MIRSGLHLLAAACAAAGLALTATADDRAIGKEAFEKACIACHGEQPVPRAKSREQFAEMPPEKIFDAQVTGLMALQASALSEIEKRAVAIYLSQVPWGSVKQEKVEEQLAMCTSTPPLTAADFEAPRWVGWGLDADNTHFQPGAHAGLTAADLDDLELKWSFGHAGATTVSTQPAVVGEWIFIGSPNGAVYALDKRRGCAHWKHATAGEVRGAIIVEPRADGRIGLWAVDRKGYVYALDANTGELIWKDRADDHPWAMITASPAVHDGHLYVALASFEELAGGSPSYECCTFRGSVVKYEMQGGTRAWKSYVIPETPQPTKKLTTGVQLYGPSGAAVWSQPTIDAAAGMLYVTTGDSYSSPAAGTSDAVVAMSLETGAIAWHVQMTAGDAFTTACVAPNADPVAKEGCGPDIDFGSSAILRTLPDGRRVLLAGQKSGVMHAIDPDNGGAILWQKRLSPGGVLGGIEWGFAADDEHLYVPISDVWETRAAPGHAGGLYKLRWADGAEVWNTPAAAPDCVDIAGCNAGQPAAATLVPGVVFSPAMDGHLRAYDVDSGKVIWDVDTKGDYDTVNGVPASGGSIKGAGVTVVDGWVYVSSGYGLFGMPGNVFLAYGPGGE
ncbi:MAG: outer membrane protein assembly factor BamB family protein [Gammaproteobacteria bacterium]